MRVHLIRPEWPLPLDPDFFFGRIDAATLIALGYRDASRYLESMTPEGIALDESAARMRDPRPGIAWRLALRGELSYAGGGELVVRACAEVEDLEALLRGEPAAAVGEVSHPALGEHVLARDGRIEIARSGRIRWELRLNERCLVLEQELAGGWRTRLEAAATARALLHEGPGPTRPWWPPGSCEGGCLRPCSPCTRAAWLRPSRAGARWHGSALRRGVHVGDRH